MTKQRFTGLLVAMFMAFLPTMVNAQFSNEMKLLASDGARIDRFGSSISIDGDTAIVGAYQDDDNGLESGSTYIYVRDPVSGIWAEQAKLLASDGVAGDQFGRAVGISGDTAIVGAPFDGPNGLDSGSVYIFVRNPSTGSWSQHVKLLAADGVTGDRFGNSVSISGGTAIVGVYGHDEGGNNTGAAYVFERNANAWTIAAQQKLLASDGADLDLFGQAVSIDGDTVVVGARSADANGSASGAAYIFVRNVGTGIWSEQQKLLASDGAIGDVFGTSVSISGDTVLIGAFGDDDNGSTSGSAYVFVRNPGTGAWVQQQKLLASDGAVGDQFSALAVSIEGDTVVVGASLHADSGSNSGAAYVFVRNSGTGVWSEQQKLLASDGAASDYFGSAVAISGSTIITGAQMDTDVNSLAGSVYVYTSTASLPDITVTDSVAPATDLQIPFGDITELTTADQSVTITNDGSADLVLGTVGAADALAAPFSLLNDNCSSQTLIPTASCTLTVRFSPASIGTFSDSFDIPSDDPDENPVTVSVSGNGVGVATPDITVTDAVAPLNDLQVPFGNVTEMTNAAQVVTVTNDGNANLLVSNVAMANALSTPFSILNDTCSNQTVAPAASCTFTVQFAPTAVGAFSDSFDIPSNDSDESSVTINVSGTGLAGPNNPPSSPSLVSPANAQTDLSTTVTLKWTPATDPDGDTLSYDVYSCTGTDPANNCTAVNVAALQTDSGNRTYYAGLGLGGSMAILGITFVGGMRHRRQIMVMLAAVAVSVFLVSCGGGGGSGGVVGDSNKSYVATGLSPGTTYYWTVIAKDGNGGETASAIWSYQTR